MINTKINTLTLDIETVPCTDIECYCSRFEVPALMAYSECLKQHEARKEECKKQGIKLDSHAPEKPKLKSEKPGLHWATGRVACIGLKEGGKPAMCIMESTEEKTLWRAYEILKDLHPFKIITFNGHSFDFPFLIVRAAKYGIPMSSYLTMNRYDRNHVDIYDVMGNKFTTNGRLAEYAHVFDCFEKIYDSGANVEELWNAGKFDDIAKHCIGDVEVTEIIYNKLFP